MVRIEGCVVQVEEAQPVPLGDGSVTADGVILVTQPHQQDYVESSCCILNNNNI